MRTKMKKPIAVLLSLLLVIGLLPATMIAAHAADYTLYFDPNGGTCGTSAVPVSTGSGNYCETTWNIPTKSGATFLGWYDVNGTQVYGANGWCTNGTGYWSGNAWVYNGNVAVYAHWDNYTVSFDANGGTCGTSAITVTIGSSNFYEITWNIPTKSGATFLGWFDANGTQVYGANGYCTNGTGYWSSNNWVYHGDRTLYAHWSTYTMTLDPNGGTVDVSALPMRSGTGDYYVLEGAGLLPRKTGYTFTGWFDANGTQVYSANNFYVAGTKYWNNSTEWIYHADVTVYAHWAPNTYTVAFNANCADAIGSTASLSATYDANAVLTANGFVRDHYTFAGWATSADGSIAYTDGAMVKNLTAVNNGTATLYAVWNENPSAITFVNEDGSLLSSQTVEPGEMPEIPESPAKAPDVNYHYIFAGWNSEVAAAHADKTYKAVYTAAAHTGMDDFICDVCEYYDAAGALADAKTKAAAAINEAAGDAPSYGVAAVSQYALVRINNATTIESVNAEKEAALDAIDALVNDKRAAYAEAQEALADAQEALTEAQTALTEKTAALTEANANLADANAALIVAEAQIDTLTADLAEAQTALAAKETALTEANEALTAEQNAKAALETQLTAKENELAALQDTVDADADEIAALEADIADLEAAITEKDGVITEKTNEITALEATVAANETAIAAAQTQIEDLTADLTAAQTQVDSLTAALAEAQTALAAKDAALTEANTNLATANAALITANAQISSLTDDVNEKAAALTTAENNLATANTALAAAEAQINGLTDDLAAANDALAAKEIALAEADEALTAALTEKTALETQLAAKETALAALQDTVDADADEIAALESDIADLEAAITEKDGVITAKTNEINTLKAGAAAYESAIAEAENEISAKEAEIASLKTRLNKALDDIEALREGIYVEPEDDGTCKYCGKIHQNVLDKFLCMIIRFFDFLVSVFDFSSAT